MGLLARLRRWCDRHAGSWREPAWPTHEPRGRVHFDGTRTKAELLRALQPGKQPTSNVVLMRKSGR